MSKLVPPDAHVLTAALGWLELGNPREALAELTGISPGNQSHPGVLEVRWAACAELQDWANAADVASELVRAAPDKVSGWLHRAYALRRQPGGGLQPAWAALRPAGDRFPDELLVAFNLACYACQLQQLDDARHWLARAQAIGGKRKIARMALADDDLKPLWPELREPKSA